MEGQQRARDGVVVSFVTTVVAVTSACDSVLTYMHIFLNVNDVALGHTNSAKVSLLERAVDMVVALRRGKARAPARL